MLEDVESKVLYFLGQMGLERAREACKPADWNREPIIGKRDPPNEDPAVVDIVNSCRDMFLGLVRAALDAQADILARIRPLDPNNPLNPEIVLHGGGVPNINVEDMAMIVEVVRRGNPNGGIPDNVLLQERIVRAAISLNIIYALIFLGMKSTRCIHLPGSHLGSHKTEEFICPKEELICLDDACGGDCVMRSKLDGRSQII